MGGAVRDILLADTIKHVLDWDLTTNALPEQIQALFVESFYENEFGTVGIAHDHLLKQMDWPQPDVFEAFLSSQVESSSQSSEPSRVIDLAVATKLHASLKPTVPHADETNTHKPQTEIPPYEITTYRSESVYTDFRRPDSIEWGSSLEEDVKRRDFTINALALTFPEDVLQTKLDQAYQTVSPTIEFLPSEYDLIDEFQGVPDLQAGIIKTVGHPDDRFSEDALRMLRAIRFSVQLNMQIDGATFDSISKHAKLILNISWERISDEFLKILKTPYPAEGIELLDQTGLLTYILPELQAGKGVEQGGHHTTHVWTHSLDALRECPSPDPIVRLATLIHDIGKPETVGSRNGEITFYNHEVVGARTAKKIAKRLKLSKKNLDRLFILVRYHMFYYQPHNTDAAIRRFMRKVGLENVDDILDLREADRLGSGAKRTSWRLEEMKQRMIEQLHQPMDTTDLAIDGHDLMAAFEKPPGPWIGQIMDELLELVLENPELNTKNELINQSKILFADKS